MADETSPTASPSRCYCREALNWLTMRVFLRNRQTRRYFASPNGWAVAIAEAFVFSSVRQAARFAFDDEKMEAEIVVRSDLFEQEVTLPLLPEWCELDQRGFDGNIEAKPSAARPELQEPAPSPIRPAA